VGVGLAAPQNNLGHVFCHSEIAHLDGVLFIDRVENIEDLYRVREDENGELVRVPVSVVAN